ncbi:MAG: winged helix-turn-helix transcriptional regulator [Candidatus Aenigmarchaeota archaeon]|nr:winged helix-turn-helix transcriptional regulator [Candidatus Aenigmarchaeota archaeon]
MADDKITLDRDTFKTLASGTRVDILKSLDSRRKTLSELSNQFSMSVSTIKEHLDNLVKAGLIEQEDDGHKWKYYDLTKKGKRILHPEDARIWIMLAVSAFALLGIGYDMISRYMFSPFYSAAANAPDALIRSTEAGKEIAQAPMAGGTAETFGQAAVQTIPWLHIAGIVVFGILLGLCVGYVIMARKRTSGMFEQA